MATRDELTAEERLILAFAEADFRKRGMNRALAMVRNPESTLVDLRAVIDYYRELWRQRHQRGHLKLVHGSDHRRRAFPR